MNSKARIHPMLLTSLIGFAAAGGFSTAQAQVMCGDVITTSEVLSADLSCSGFNPALTIQGPNGRLNMRHFTLSCEGSGATGILMTNSGPRVRNGTVANCRNGVLLDGSRAQVSRMILRDNSDTGLVLLSGNGHRISDTAAILNNGGFDFFGGGDGNNFINRVRATHNTFIGFGASDNDRYTRNVATSNGIGFSVGDGNTLSRNTSITTRTAFSCQDEASNNTLTGNIARNNFDDGIDLESASRNNTLSDNNASGRRG